MAWRGRVSIALLPTSRGPRSRVTLTFLWGRGVASQRRPTLLVSVLFSRYLSAISRLSPGYLTAISALSLGYLTAISALSLGYLSAIGAITTTWNAYRHDRAGGEEWWWWSSCGCVYGP